MKIIKMQQGTPEWKNLRLGKITGAKIGDVMPAVTVSKEKVVEAVEKLGVDFKKTAKKEDLLALLPEATVRSLKAQTMSEADRKMGFYQVIADRVAYESDTDESPIERGTRLEPEAIEVYMEMTGKKVETDIGLCVSSDNENIAYSPDGVIIEDFKIKEDLEVKCLSSAKHLMAYFEQEIPSEYWPQMIQGFVVNPDLEKRHMVFYDPRVMSKNLHVITLHRKDVLEDIEAYREYQEFALKEIEAKVSELIAF